MYMCVVEKRKIIHVAMYMRIYSGCIHIICTCILFNCVLIMYSVHVYVRMADTYMYTCTLVSYIQHIL